VEFSLTRNMGDSRRRDLWRRAESGDQRAAIDLAEASYRMRDLRAVGAALFMAGPTTAADYLSRFPVAGPMNALGGGERDALTAELGRVVLEHYLVPNAPISELPPVGRGRRPRRFIYLNLIWEKKARVNMVDVEMMTHRDGVEFSIRARRVRAHKFTDRYISGRRKRLGIIDRLTPGLSHLTRWKGSVVATPDAFQSIGFGNYTSGAIDDANDGEVLDWYALDFLRDFRIGWIHGEIPPFRLSGDALIEVVTNPDLFSDAVSWAFGEHRRVVIRRMFMADLWLATDTIAGMSALRVTRYRNMRRARLVGRYRRVLSQANRLKHTPPLLKRISPPLKGWEQWFVDEVTATGGP